MFTLRKGQSSVYLMYELGGDSIGANNFALEQRGDVVVLSFQLHPVDSNQRADEQRLHTEILTEVHLSDSFIINNLQQFLSSSHITAESLALEITSLEKVLHFPIAIGPAGIGFLPLVVQR